jgi:hypothetical protein
MSVLVCRNPQRPPMNIVLITSLRVALVLSSLGALRLQRGGRSLRRVQGRTLLLQTRRHSRHSHVTASDTLHDYRAEFSTYGKIRNIPFSSKTNFYPYRIELFIPVL